MLQKAGSKVKKLVSRQSDGSDESERRSASPEKHGGYSPRIEVRVLKALRGEEHRMFHGAGPEMHTNVHERVCGCRTVGV